MKWKFRVECFEGYQLNRWRNFLKSKRLFEMESNEEVMDTCTLWLKAHNCPNSAVFVLSYDDSMFAVLNIEDSEEEVEVLCHDGFDAEFFAKVDAEYRLCCYGLIIEVRPNEWKVIEV